MAAELCKAVIANMGSYYPDEIDVATELRMSSAVGAEEAVRRALQIACDDLDARTLAIEESKLSVAAS